MYGVREGRNRNARIEDCGGGVAAGYAKGGTNDVRCAAPVKDKCSLVSLDNQHNSVYTQSTGTSPTYQLPPLPISANFNSIYILSFRHSFQILRKPTPRWQSQWCSGKWSSLSAKKIISTMWYLKDHYQSRRGFLLTARAKWYTTAL